MFLCVKFDLLKGNPKQRLGLTELPQLDSKQKRLHLLLIKRLSRHRTIAV